MPSILIIDDDTRFRELLTEILEASGHDVLAVSGRRAAVGLAQLPFRPQLILVDLKMEGMDGYQTITALRADKELRGVPTILLTSSDTEGVAAAARSAGATGFLTKPIISAKLHAQIDRVLRDCHLVWIDDHHTVTSAPDRRLNAAPLSCQSGSKDLHQ